MSSLAEFLLTCFGEDAAWARIVAANAPPMEAGASGSAHLATSPDRVLADIKWKRRIVEMIHQPTRGRAESFYCSECQPGDYWESYSRSDWPCATLLALAQPYADHEGFRQEWRVS